MATARDPTAAKVPTVLATASEYVVVDELGDEAPVLVPVPSNGAVFSDVSASAEGGFSAFGASVVASFKAAEEASSSRVLVVSVD